jgi:hypothetical protein
VPNPLDQAILARARSEVLDIGGTRKLDEIPYDFALAERGCPRDGCRAPARKGFVGITDAAASSAPRGTAY